MSSVNTYVSPVSPLIATPTGVKVSVLVLMVVYGVIVLLLSRLSWLSGDRHFQLAAGLCVVSYAVCAGALYQYHQLLVAVNVTGRAGASDLTLLKQYETVGAVTFTLPIAVVFGLAAFKAYRRRADGYKYTRQDYDDMIAQGQSLFEW